GEDPQTIELHLPHESEQVLKILLRLTGEPNDDRSADRHIRNAGANLLDQRQDVALPARTAHAPENAIFAVLQGHIDVLADFRVGSDRLQKLFVESTRIEIMKANPAYPFHFGNAVQK